MSIPGRIHTCDFLLLLLLLLLLLPNTG
jgi:hypothetical protein